MKRSILHNDLAGGQDIADSAQRHLYVVSTGLLHISNLLPLVFVFVFVFEFVFEFVFVFVFVSDPIRFRRSHR